MGGLNRGLGGGQRIAIADVQMEVDAFAREGPCGGEADALRGASDEGAPAAELKVRGVISRRQEARVSIAGRPR
jgi:hypothetical protein